MAKAPPSLPVVLTIAGSDPSGGAGLQVDLKVFQQHGVYGAAAVSLLTVQNTRGVTGVEVLDPRLVCAQVDAVVDDLPVAAAKTGALGSAAVIAAVAERAADFRFPLIVDPVIVSKHGDPLLPREAVATLRERLLPRAAVLTPNVHEVSALTGLSVTGEESMVAAGEALRDAGARCVVIKGGGLRGAADDLLLDDGGPRWLRATRIDTTRLHGTGCAFAAAIAARLALGAALDDAVLRAKSFVRRAIRRAPAFGHGVGPIDTTVAADEPARDPDE